MAGAFPTLKSGNTVFYPLQDSHSFGTNIARFMDDSEQRYRSRNMLRRFRLTCNDINAYDVSLIMKHYRSQFGRFDSTWSLTIAGNTYANLAYDTDSFTMTENKVNRMTIAFNVTQVQSDAPAIPKNSYATVVNTAAKTVTWVSGDHFIAGTAWVGRSIVINSVTYVVAGLSSTPPAPADPTTTVLYVMTTVGTQTGVNLAVTFGKYFPQINPNGVMTTLPYTSSFDSRTVLEDSNFTGRRFAWKWRANPLGRYGINLQALTDAELALVKNYYYSMEGRKGEFALLDPGGNLVNYSDDYSNASWTKTSISVGAAKTDPKGGNLATSLSSSATSGLIYTTVIPDGGAYGFVITGSVWARSPLYASVVNVAVGGLAVTWVSGSDFSLLVPGQQVIINGVPKIVNVVTDSTHFTITAAFGTSLTGATSSFAFKQTLAIGFLDNGLNNLGYSIFNLNSVWTQIFYSLALTTDAPVILNIGGANTWGTGQAIELFSVGCAPLPGPGPRLLTPGFDGLRKYCRFDTDDLAISYEDFGKTSAVLPIAEYTH